MNRNGLLVLVLVVLAAGSAFAQPDPKVKYQVMDIRKEQVISKNPDDYSAGKGFKLINLPLLERNQLGTLYVIAKRDKDSSRDNFIQFVPEIVNEMFPLFDIRTEGRYNFVVYLSVQPKDPANPKGDKYYRLDDIEGLMSLEEAQATVDQKEAAKAERTAQEEARKQAQAEANRYDPSKFTVVPDSFSPSHYDSADLFKAVSASKNLDIASSKPEALNRQGRFMGNYFLMYKSDLTFVRQNGIDITFSSDDNAITQNMSIDQRSGLQAGQKVRVYYMVSRTPLTTWDVIAIERL